MTHEIYLRRSFAIMAFSRNETPACISLDCDRWAVLCLDCDRQTMLGNYFALSLHCQLGGRGFSWRQSGESLGQGRELNRPVSLLYFGLTSKIKNGNDIIVRWDRIYVLRTEYISTTTWWPHGNNMGDDLMANKWILSDHNPTRWAA